jgi:hypothetical protein
MWHHDLKYLSCPIGQHQRDMGTCQKCPCRVSKIDDKRSINGMEEKKDATSKVSKKRKEAIPNIGKTYSSEE